MGQTTTRIIDQAMEKMAEAVQLPESISIPGSLSVKAVKDIQLHGFGDAARLEFAQQNLCSCIRWSGNNTGTYHIKGESGKKEPEHT